MARRRSWVFTSFKNKQDFLQSIEDEQGGKITYITFGEETCPKTGKEHLQGYVEFNAAYGRSRTQSILGDATLHVEPREGSQEEAITYAQKNGRVFEGEERRQQGRRRDLEAIRGLVGEGKGLRKVIEAGASYTGIRYAEKVLTYCELPREGKPTVRWYWGRTGTGKTRAAVEEAERDYGRSELWWSNSSLKWFDGYDAHKVRRTLRLLHATPTEGGEALH